MRKLRPLLPPPWSPDHGPSQPPGRAGDRYNLPVQIRHTLLLSWDDLDNNTRRYSMLLLGL